LEITTGVIMKAVSFAVAGLFIAQTSSAQDCSYMARDLNRAISNHQRDSTSLDRSLGDLDYLATALNEAAKLVGSGSSVDLRQELNPLVSEVESQVRSAQNPMNDGLNLLRSILAGNEGGSGAYRAAARVADMHSNAKDLTQAAERRVDPLRERISQVNDRLKDNSQLARARQNIMSGLRAISAVEQSIGQLSSLDRLPRQVRDYNSSCNLFDDNRCRDLRSEMGRSADNCRASGRDLESRKMDLRALSSDTGRLADGLRGGSSIDVHGALTGILDRDVVPYIQDGFNNLSVSSDHARRASTAESGVEFDRLIKDICVPSSEKAVRLSAASLSGISSLRSTIDSLARQIGSGSNVTPAELQAAARQVTDLADKVSYTNEELTGRRGELERMITALDDSERYCRR
jgi:predicted  nucleic acid-binding Zn-ribbon protein